MSRQIIFTQRSSSNALIMENIFQMADCCRTCLRMEGSLTPTVTEDNDSIKFCDKLSACVSEVVNINY